MFEKSIKFYDKSEVYIEGFMEASYQIIRTLKGDINTFREICNHEII